MLLLRSRQEKVGHPTQSSAMAAHGSVDPHDLGATINRLPRQFAPAACYEPPSLCRTTRWANQCHCASEQTNATVRVCEAVPLSKRANQCHCASVQTGCHQFNRCQM